MEAAGDDDTALVARCAAGDRSAFEVLMSRHLATVHALARRLTGSAADAEDIAQETFLRAWTAAPTWRPGAARFSTWLHRVALNLSYDALRGRRRIGPTPPEDPPDERPTPAESLEARERDARLAAAVDRLPERQRAAIVLTYQTGLSNAEAARTMDMSVKALETLLVRARRTLREALSEAPAPGVGGT